MYSIKIVCLVLCCLQCFIVVKSEIKPQQDAANSTLAEDRKDVQWKKPPRKRGTFGFNYGSGFPGFHSKSLSYFKKEHTPTLIEKYVPVPVHVKVPVDRVVPVHIPKLYPIPVEKPVAVPIKVPQPYPVYKKVAVPVKVYVEKQVDKPVPFPVKVPVDRPIPVYIPVEKSPEKHIKWQPEKSLSMSTGKSMLWFEKPDTPFTVKEEPENEKTAQSWFELPEQSESGEISWLPETAELEVRK